MLLKTGFGSCRPLPPPAQSKLCENRLHCENRLNHEPSLFGTPVPDEEGLLSQRRNVEDSGLL